MALQTGFAVKGPDPAPFLVKFAGLLRNVAPIEGAAAGRGLFSINPERDGIVRRVPVVMMAQDVLVPSLRRRCSASSPTPAPSWSAPTKPA
jgi:adenylate cyclase